jgi:hypothetical protein
MLQPDLENFSALPWALQSLASVVRGYDGVERSLINCAIAKLSASAAAPSASTTPARSVTGRFWLAFHLPNNLLITISMPTMASNCFSINGCGASLTCHGAALPFSKRSVNRVTRPRSQLRRNVDLRPVKNHQRLHVAGIIAPHRIGPRHMTTQCPIGRGHRIEFERDMVGIEPFAPQGHQSAERILAHQLVQNICAGFFKMTR